MEEKKKIAEAEAREVMEWFHNECKKITEKYKDIPGIDKGIREEKELAHQAHEKIQEIKKKYNLD